MNRSILDTLTREELPTQELKDLADVIGINKLKEVLIKMPGQRFYIPKWYLREVDDNFILKNYTSQDVDKNVEKIGQRLGLTTRTVYRRISRLRASGQLTP